MLPPHRLISVTTLYIFWLVTNTNCLVEAEDSAVDVAGHSRIQADGPGEGPGPGSMGPLDSKACSASLAGDVRRYYRRYHASEACGEENPQVTAALEHERYEIFQHLNQHEGGDLHQRVPDTQTVVCPASDTRSSLHVPNSVSGLKTAWMVENTASTPVVLTWVDGTTGQEYSAAHGMSPPQADSEATLQPGEHKVVYGYEGHVFHVRAIHTDGSLGEVLLQHRLGLIPVGVKKETIRKLAAAAVNGPENSKRRKQAFQRNKQKAAMLAKDKGWMSQAYFFANKAKKMVTNAGFYASAIAAIVPAILMDTLLGTGTLPSAVEQVLDEADVLAVADLEGLEEDHEPLTAAFQRTLADETTRPPHIRECHHVNLGFRNKAKIPLHVHWVDPQSCQEIFKFHLGTESRGLANYANDWKSNTKFESTFMGHTYVVRMASSDHADPTTLPVIETIQLLPTQVIDCPNTKDAQPAQLGTANMDIMAASTVLSGQPVGTYDDAVILNSTLSNLVEQVQQVTQRLPAESRNQNKRDVSETEKDSIADLLDPSNYQRFLEKLQGNPERIRHFIDYIKSQEQEYDQEETHTIDTSESSQSYRKEDEKNREHDVNPLQEETTTDGAHQYNRETSTTAN